MLAVTLLTGRAHIGEDWGSAAIAQNLFFCVNTAVFLLPLPLPQYHSNPYHCYNYNYNLAGSSFLRGSAYSGFSYMALRTRSR